MGSQGVTEIPMDVPSGLRRVLTQLRETVISIRSSQAPLAPPTNVKGTALAFANLIQWTRVTGADYYEVLWNTVPSSSSAQVQGVGDSAQWVDNVGQVAIKRTYWVRARKYIGASSALSSPVTLTTLASGTGVNPPPPPPPGHIQVVDQSTGHPVYLPVTGGGGKLNLL